MYRDVVEQRPNLCGLQGLVLETPGSQSSGRILKHHQFPSGKRKAFFFVKITILLFQIK